MMDAECFEGAVNTAAHKRPFWCAWCGKRGPTLWKTTRAYTFGFHEKCRDEYDDKAEACGYPRRSRIIMALLRFTGGPG